MSRAGQGVCKIFVCESWLFKETHRQVPLLTKMNYLSHPHMYSVHDCVSSVFLYLKKKKNGKEKTNTHTQTLILSFIYSSNSNAGLFTSKHLHNKPTISLECALLAPARRLKLVSSRAVCDVAVRTVLQLVSGLIPAARWSGCPEWDVLGLAPEELLGHWNQSETSIVFCGGPLALKATLCQY